MHATLDLVLRLRGGMQTIIFNSLNEPIITNLGSTGPKWWRIDKGLNLLGICQNKSCEAFRQQVYIIKGFGTFNMNKEVNCSKCPICHEIAEEVVNMVLYLANCSSKGMIQGEKK